MKRHVLIFIEKIRKTLMLGFKVCYPNSMTMVIFRDRDEKFLNKIIKKNMRKKCDMTTMAKRSL